jgi:dihydroorotate dehydrogenase
MTPTLASALLPALRRIDPERAHGLALRALGLGLAGADTRADDPALAVRALGIDFANPIGLAAGFDKDARALAGLARLGFGHLEVGTVTPRPQAGNPRPRLFRLDADAAVVNRMGFNNAGLAALLARLARRRPGGPPLGINVGINKEGADPERDYPALVAAVAPHAAYVTLNVSSPNTPGLRDLQGEARLRAVLGAIGPHPVPLLVKVAPDLSEAGLAAVIEASVDHGVAGLIVGNTTLSRPDGLRSPHAAQAGGLSGAPLRSLATAMLARAALMARGRLVLVGCGGVATGADALEKIRAGATLVQLYTAFAYHGPALVGRLKADLRACLRQAGFSSVTEAIGTDAEALASEVRCNS